MVKEFLQTKKFDKIFCIVINYILVRANRLSSDKNDNFCWQLYHVFVQNKKTTLNAS